MTIIVCDFETYYDVNYSLSKLSTEEYIRDKRFEVIGCAISVGGKRAVWYSGEEVEPALRALPWESSSLLSYNTVFDGAILAWHYNLRPALYLDAMGMAKACGKTYKGASLSKVAELLSVGEKGQYVALAKGKRLADFLPHELGAYGIYCRKDVELTIKIYRALQPQFPSSEALIQDLNLRLFIEPLLRFDVPRLKLYQQEVIAKKWKQLVKVAGLLGLDWGDVELPTDTSLLQTYAQLDDGKLISKMKTELASNPRFAALLISLGVEPPEKLSPTTGQITFAFAKTDPEFMELLEHDDPSVQSLIAARLGIKSTIEETRAERFLDIATRGPWPVQYNYYGANTSRFSGAGNANPQNLKRGGRLRDAILPSPGHTLIAADLGQIECRVLNYLAGQDDVIQAFESHDRGEGPDVYCILAEKIYRKPVKPGDDERMVGKVGELQLGFGGGWKAFKRTLFKEAPDIVMTQHECQGVVDIYRTTHENVRGLWKQGDVALGAMRRGLEFDLGRTGMLTGTVDGIRLPNGLRIAYPELTQAANGQTGEMWYEYTNRGKKVKIYGSVVVQNVTEALSRLILTDAWLRISKRLRVVLHTHDELVCVAPHADIRWALEFMAEEMTRPVPWAPGLPLACDAKSGGTYGETKS